MWNIIKDSENYKHAYANRWPLEGCGESYDGQYDWTQVTCFRPGFFHTEYRSSWFFQHWSVRCVFCVEIVELFNIIQLNSSPGQCGILSGQSDAGTGLSASTLVYHCHYY
jgi:hypothetical protein